ncbi:MAG: biotin/lipoyl-containing protein, partial [Candidatus Nanopelagicales bacterium]
MTGSKTFNLPDLGEGLTEGEVLRWMVKEGDAIEVNQPLVEIETAKAAVELPSPFAGTIETRHADEGVTIAVGAPLVTIAVAGGAKAEPVSTPVADPETADTSAATDTGDAE